MSVVHSRLLYSAPIWAEEVKRVAKYSNLLLQSQRCAALRVARCYRTVSDIAALVLARMPPVTLQAIGRKRVAVARKAGAVLESQVIEEEIIREWQVMWDSTTKVSWTRKLIPDLRSWWYHGPSDISFHMAQVLTGHGCFQGYLWKKKIALSPGCFHCPANIDDAEYTIFAARSGRRREPTCHSP